MIASLKVFAHKLLILWLIKKLSETLSIISLVDVLLLVLSEWQV